MAREKQRSGLEILVVEDDDTKFQDIARALRDDVPTGKVRRVETEIEADDLLERGGWDLLVLDISMNISPGSSGPFRGGHANLGGMGVAERMHLQDLNVPTVIVTGFDYFRAQGGTEESELVGFADIDSRARHMLGTDLLGCVRYGHPGWRRAFSNALRRLRTK